MFRERHRYPHTLAEVLPTPVQGMGMTTPVEGIAQPSVEAAILIFGNGNKLQALRRVCNLTRIPNCVVQHADLEFQGCSRCKICSPACIYLVRESDQYFCSECAPPGAEEVATWHVDDLRDLGTAIHHYPLDDVPCSSDVGISVSLCTFDAVDAQRPWRFGARTTSCLFFAIARHAPASRGRYALAMSMQCQ